jgi:hypothetical protein
MYSVIILQERIKGLSFPLHFFSNYVTFTICPPPQKKNCLLPLEEFSLANQRRNKNL